METVTTQVIEWGGAGRPLSGQQESGDQYWVHASGQKAVVAVVDGLGHGKQAASAAAAAIASLERHGDESPLSLVEHCCEELTATRGVVMSVAEIDGAADTLTWLGVGNVEGFLLHRNVRAVPNPEVLIVRPGVVGDGRPRLAPAVVHVVTGDLLIFATDGIRPGFVDRLNPRQSPQQIADWILDEYGQETDDTLVLVVRYLHGQGKTTR